MYFWRKIIADHVGPMSVKTLLLSDPKDVITILKKTLDVLSSCIEGQWGIAFLSVACARAHAHYCTCVQLLVMIVNVAWTRVFSKLKSSPASILPKVLPRGSYLNGSNCW